jgi:hypothetical protein
MYKRKYSPVIKEAIACICASQNESDFNEREKERKLSVVCEKQVEAAKKLDSN